MVSLDEVTTTCIGGICIDALLTLVEAQERFRAILSEWQIQQEELLQKAFQYVTAQYVVSYEQLTNHLFSKRPFELTNFTKIAVIPIGDHFLVRAISHQNERADLQQLERHLRGLLELKDWYLYTGSVAVYRFYILFVQQLYSKKAAVQLLNTVTRKMLKTKQKSLPLKQMQLLYVVYLFAQKSCYSQREIKEFERRWTKGEYNLNEKEMVLLRYMKMHLAARRKHWQKVRFDAAYLLQEDLLASYAVELTVDFGVLLPSYSTDADVFIKVYTNHYVAYTCYLFVQALDQMKAYTSIVTFLKREPIASCTMLYTYFQTRYPDDLVRVETVVQQNIGVLMDGHHSNVRASIQRWQELKQQGKGQNEFYLTLSEHVCRLIRACFIEGELLVFEKLMTIYMKYLFVEHHFQHLKKSLQNYTDLVQVNEQVMNEAVQ